MVATRAKTKRVRRSVCLSTYVKVLMTHHGFVAARPLAPLGEWGSGLIWPFRTLTIDRDLGSDAVHMYYSGTEGIHGDMYSTQPMEDFAAKRLGAESATWGYTDLRLKAGGGGSEQQYLSPVRSSIWFHGAFMRATWRHGRLWAVLPASGGGVPATLLSKPINLTTSRLDRPARVARQSSRAARTRGEDEEVAVRLVANLATYRNGQATAELVGPSGEPLEGFGLEQSVAFQGDEPRGIMQWRGSPTLPLHVDVVQVRFVLERARLYGFRLTIH